MSPARLRSFIENWLDEHDAAIGSMSKFTQLGLRYALSRRFDIVVSRQAMAKVRSYEDLIERINPPPASPTKKRKPPPKTPAFESLRALLEKNARGLKTRSDATEFALLRVRQRQAVPLAILQQQRGGKVKLRLFVLRWYRRLNSLLPQTLGEQLKRDGRTFVLSAIDGGQLKALQQIVSRAARLTRADAVTDD